MSADDQYTSYQARTHWYMEHFHVPPKVHRRTMEHSETMLGIMEFSPSNPHRPFWTYATNGMSERQMPCETPPHGDPQFRTKLIAYSLQPAAWIIDLLEETATYPFRYRSGLSIGHTVPVQEEKQTLWSGYVLCEPLFEPEEFNPLPIDIGIQPDWVFFAQIAGLLEPELQFGIQEGGAAIFEKLKDCHATSQPERSPAFLDVSRDRLTTI